MLTRKCHPLEVVIKISKKFIKIFLKKKINNEKNSIFFGEDVKDYINDKKESLISVLNELK